MTVELQPPPRERGFCFWECMAVALMSAVSPVVLAWQEASEVYSHVHIQTHSEPVPVMDMVGGWDGPFESGRYAFGDARFVIGLNRQHWFLEREQRWHYDLRFSRGMSRYYFAQEHGDSVQHDESLMLDVRSIEAWGARVGRRIAFQTAYGAVSLRPAFILYRVGHFQFGHLSGKAEAGGQDQASAQLHYFYDEDKILEHDPFVDKGWGLSTDVVVDWEKNQWQAKLVVHDLVNQWRWEDAAYTTACINFNDPAESICSSSGTASGRSGQRKYIARLLPTASARLTHQIWQTQVRLDWHGHYQRMGVTRFLLDKRLGLSAFSSRQLGIEWQSDWVSFYWQSDDLRLSYARDIDMGLSFNVAW